MDTVRVGMMGSKFIAEIHAESFASIPNAEIVAVASPTKEHVSDFAARHGIAKWFTDYRALLELDEVPAEDAADALAAAICRGHQGPLAGLARRPRPRARRPRSEFVLRRAR